jgi:hypothetical protein
VAGLNSKAQFVTRGAISLSNSTHLPAIVGSIVIKPVMLSWGVDGLLGIRDFRYARYAIEGRSLLLYDD